MIDTTVCFVRRGDEILLGKKKVRFGAGLWNGFGGKIEKNETPVQAARRELKEESGIETEESSLKKCALIRCHFPERNEFDHLLHIFITDEFTGTEQESDEMFPAWHAINNLPYEEMWPSDRVWVPLVITEGKIIEGDIYFGETNPPFKVIKNEFHERNTLE